jgi:hypothetical protein
MVQELKHDMLAAQDGDSCRPAAGPVLRQAGAQIGRELVAARFPLKAVREFPLAKSNGPGHWFTVTARTRMQSPGTGGVRRAVAEGRRTGTGRLVRQSAGMMAGVL